MNAILRLNHVTPTVNMLSIARQGLLPAYSQGKRKVIWLAELPKLTWALAHVSARHGVPVSMLTVLLCQLPEQALIRTRWPNVFMYPQTIYADTLGIWGNDELVAYLNQDGSDY